MSDRDRCWFGAVMGHTVPMARLAVAGMRATRLSDTDTGVEHFLDRNAGPDAFLIADVCTAMAKALRSLGTETGNPETSLVISEAIWIEPMGCDGKPDSDDYIIAVDPCTGDFCYDQLMVGNPQARSGAAFCLEKISEFIKERIGRGQ
ncbi:hypothetical protein [Bifidobacterium ruminantium]|uniref:hypothetical protein n=1 Tax=Bifidobacterium ruminantium TaxID=78346 RepID=UPI002491842D|nr:hypothetical protein [Bifidobacterium ruminantium]